MNLTEQVCAQAMVLSGGLEEAQKPMLRALCSSAVASLSRRLREGLTPEDCKADFVAAASLYALAAFSEIDEVHQLEAVQAGDVTLHRRTGDTAANCLRTQAELMICAYVGDRFAFLGV